MSEKIVYGLNLNSYAVTGAPTAVTNVTVTYRGNYMNIFRNIASNPLVKGIKVECVGINFITASDILAVYFANSEMLIEMDGMVKTQNNAANDMTNILCNFGVSVRDYVPRIIFANPIYIDNPNTVSYITLTMINANTGAAYTSASTPAYSLQLHLTPIFD